MAATARHDVRSAPGVITLAVVGIGLPVARDLFLRLYPAERGAVAFTVYAALVTALVLVLLQSGIGLREAGVTPPAFGPVLLGSGAALAVLLPGMAGWHTVRGPSLALVAWVALAASTEELLFRGVLFAALNRIGGPVLGVLGSSAGFTLAHLGAYPSPAILIVAVAGLYLGVLRALVGNLWAPGSAHVWLDLFGAPG